MTTMNQPETLEQLLARLEPKITVRDLAENWCDPLWQAKRFARAEEMMVAIGKMEELSARARPEIEKALIDQFALALESSDTAHLEKLAPFMAAFLPEEVNRQIMAVALDEALAQEKELTSDNEFAQDKTLPDEPTPPKPRLPRL